MKKLRLLSLASFAALLVFVACSADDMSGLPSTDNQIANGSDPSSPGSGGPESNFGTGRIASSIACNAYEIALESITPIGGGKYEWIWSVRNLNPGNGYGGTTQDLSNWGMTLGSCVSFSSVVSAAYSANGTTWTSFTPEYHTYQNTCLTVPAIKFDFGTTGSAPSYYKLVVNQNYQWSYIPGYYKSGSVTGCCIFNFNAIGCPGGTDE